MQAYNLRFLLRNTNNTQKMSQMLFSNMTNNKDMKAMRNEAEDRNFSESGSEEPGSMTSSFRLTIEEENSIRSKGHKLGQKAFE